MRPHRYASYSSASARGGAGSNATDMIEHSEAQGLLSDAQQPVPQPLHKLPVLLELRSSKWFILITICVALFTDSFIYGVLVPVLPFMLRDRSHIKDGTEQIWTSALFASFGGAILVGSVICGWLADRTEARRFPLLLSLPVLAGATALLGSSGNVWVLLISRGLQGLSTAAVWTVGLALTRDTVRRDEVGQCMGIAISSSSVGLVISPMLGGIIYAGAGLWGVLGIMIGLVGLNILLVILMIEKRIAKIYYEGHRNEHDNRTAYETFRQIGAIEEPRERSHYPDNDENQDQDPSALSSQQPSVLTRLRWKLNLKKRFSRRKMPPMLRLLRSPRILTSAYGVFTQFGMLASFDAFLPLFVKRRFEWGSLGAGLIFLTIAIPQLLGPLAGKLSDRFGPRRVAFAGCILTTPPLLLLRVVGYNSVHQVVLLCLLLVAIGIFLTLIIAPLAADLSFAADQLEADNPGIFGDKGAYGQAYALFNCAMAAATFVGPMVAGSVQDRFGSAAVATVLGCWCGSAAIPVLFFIGDKSKPDDTIDEGDFWQA